MNLSRFADNLIFLHGLSGSGKGDETVFLNQIAEEKDYKLIVLGSGDGFRETLSTINTVLTTGDGKLTDEQALTKEILDQTMQKGRLVPTLHPVISKLKSTFKEYIISTIKGEKVALVLDGFLRIDEMVYTNKDLKMAGVKIPSQFEQIAEVFARALREVCDDRANAELIAVLDPELMEKVRNHEVIDLLDVKKEGLTGEISIQVLEGANHSFIDIPRGDAEALMRFRALKSLEKVISVLDAFDGEGLGTKFIESRLALREGMFLLSGNYEVADGTVIISDELDRDRVFEHFARKKGVWGDKAMMDIVAHIYRIHGQDFNPNKSSLKGAVDLVITAFKKTTGGNPMDELNADMSSSFRRKPRLKGREDVIKDAEDQLTEPLKNEIRADDALYYLRDSRAGAYFRYALPGIIHDRLGAELKAGENGVAVGIDKESSVFLRKNFVFIQNGPSVGVTYSKLQSQCEDAVRKVFMNISTKVSER